MSVYKHSSGKRFLFIHIPRTAGRFIEKNLERQDWEWDNNLSIKKQYESVDDVEVAHFHRELYEKHLDVNGIPHITVVRNPIDRFISASIYLKRMYGDDIQSLIEDEMYFYSMLHNFPIPESRNWYRPQVHFVSNKTHVWKFEDGFGENFSKWMSNILGVEVEMKKVDYRPDADESNKLERSVKLVSLLKDFYSDDLMYFNYPS